MSFENQSIEEIKAELLAEQPSIDDIARLIYAYEGLLQAKDSIIHHQAHHRTLSELLYSSSSHLAKPKAKRGRKPKYANIADKINKVKAEIEQYKKENNIATRRKAMNEFFKEYLKEHGRQKFKSMESKEAKAAIKELVTYWDSAFRHTPKYLK